MEKINYHISLASYFSASPNFFDGDLQKKPHIRKCVELPFQQTKAGLWDEITDTICNLDFIQAKAVAKMTYDLVKDFNDVMEVIPDNAENIRQEKTRKARMEKYTRDLIACAKGEIRIDELEIPASITPWTQKQIEIEIIRIKTNPTRLDRLKDFVNFLAKEALNLENYANEFPHFTTQQAWNFTDNGSVGVAAEKVEQRGKNVIFRSQSTRPIYDPIPKSSKVLRGHTSNIIAIAVTPNGKRAITGSLDNKCIFWDLFTGKKLKTLIGHTNIITSISMTPDGMRAISGSSDKTCILWDLNTGETLRKLNGHHHEVTAITITPDGLWALSGSEDGTCILWNLITGEIFRTLKEHNDSVTALTISPDGKWAFSGAKDGTCILWNITTGKALRSLKGHIYPIIALSFNPTGSKAITFSSDLRLIFWNLDRGIGFPIIYKEFTWASSASITPDGSLIVISDFVDCTFKLMDLRTGKHIKTFKGHSSPVSATSITPDGSLMFSGSMDGTCILWDLNADEDTKEYFSPIETFAIIPVRMHGISCHSDSHCILWDLNKGKIVKILKGPSGRVQAISVSKNGNQAFLGSGINCILMDLNSGEVLKTFKGHDGGVTTVSITPDGNLAISGSWDQKCILWDINSGQVIKLLETHSKPILFLSPTPDGRHVLSSSATKNCILWDLYKGEPLKIFKGHTGMVEQVSITPDGKIAISHSWDGTSILWNLITGESIRAFKGYGANASGIPITPDGRKVILYGSHYTCILLNLNNGVPCMTFRGHSGHINAISIAQDASQAVTGSTDNTCIFWDLNSGDKMARFVSSSSIEVVCFFSGGVFGLDSSGSAFVIRRDGELLQSRRNIITIRRIWDFLLEKYQSLSADCSLCGHRFEPPNSVLITINKITKNSNLRPEQSPCLELPDEAWEDPGLLGNCPKCGAELKFNPFIAGGENY